MYTLLVRCSRPLHTRFHAQESTRESTTVAGASGGYRETFLVVEHRSRVDALASTCAEPNVARAFATSVRATRRTRRGRARPVGRARVWQPRADSNCRYRLERAAS